MRKDKFLKIKAPAKINLFLKVGKILSSGYHQVSSIMQSLELADLITIFPSDDIELSCNISELVGEKNLIFKAALLLKETFSLEKGASFKLEKNIPVAAGLGGGSSNAAAALLGLNKLWNLRLSEEEIAELAAKLGADVPFFLKGGTQLAEDYGLKLTPLPSLLNKPYVILANPGYPLSTKEIYQKFDQSSPREIPFLKPAVEALKRGSLPKLSKAMANSLEYVVIQNDPGILAIKERALAAGALGAMVSGSGPTVFALAEKEKEALRISAALKEVTPNVILSTFSSKGVTFLEGNF